VVSRRWPVIFVGDGTGLWEVQNHPCLCEGNGEQRKEKEAGNRDGKAKERQCRDGGQHKGGCVVQESMQEER